MKRSLQSGLLLILVSSSVSVLAANGTPTKAELIAQIQQVSKQTLALQKEVQELRAEVKSLRATKSTPASSTHPAAAAQTATAQRLPQPNGTTHYPGDGHFKHKNYLNPDAPRAQDKYYMFHYGEGVTVITSPIMGLRTAFDASDLLEAKSTMNEDLLLLRGRQYLQNMLTRHGYSLSDRPVVILSGGVEGQAIAAGGYGDARGDINVDRAEIDVHAMVSSWASAFMSLQYSDAPPITGSRVENSRVYLARGFLTIGNLDASPIYFTIGQMYVPFGRYASGMLTSPITLSLFRTLVRAAMLGYSHNGLYAQLYGYRGNQRNGGHSPLKQGGFNLGFEHKTNAGAFNMGAGVITSVIDSEGQQNNFLPSTVGIGTPGVIQFQGFGVSTFPNTDIRDVFVHRVPGLDLHGEWNMGHFTFIGEYIAALDTFAAQDLRFNGRGAKLKAMHTELDYLFHFGVHPVTIGVAYDQSWQAFAMNLPKQSYAIFLNTSIWKDTVETIEYRHDEDYHASTGNSGGYNRSITTGGIGATRNTVTAQIGVYF